MGESGRGRPVPAADAGAVAQFNARLSSPSTCPRYLGAHANTHDLHCGHAAFAWHSQLSFWAQAGSPTPGIEQDTEHTAAPARTKHSSPGPQANPAQGFATGAPHPSSHAAASHA
jgi:hypothetical protein